MIQHKKVTLFECLCSPFILARWEGIHKNRTSVVMAAPSTLDNRKPLGSTGSINRNNIRNIYIQFDVQKYKPTSHEPTMKSTKFLKQHQHHWFLRMNHPSENPCCQGGPESAVVWALVPGSQGSTGVPLGDWALYAPAIGTSGEWVPWKLFWGRLILHVFVGLLEVISTCFCRIFWLLFLMWMM